MTPRQRLLKRASGWYALFSGVCVGFMQMNPTSSFVDETLAVSQQHEQPQFTVLYQTEACTFNSEITCRRTCFGHDIAC